jgi:hypothetical protein
MTPYYGQQAQSRADLRRSAARGASKPMKTMLDRRYLDENGLPLPGAPVGNRVIPGASVYQGAEVGAKLELDQALSGLDAQLLRTRSQFGFMPGGRRLDGRNQYGLIQQLMRAKAQDQEQLEQQTASRGISGPGLAQQGQDRLRFDQGLQTGQLMQGYQGQVHENQGARRGAISDYGTSLRNAELSALQYALANNIHTPAVLPGMKKTVQRLLAGRR